MKKRWIVLLVIIILIAVPIIGTKIYMIANKAEAVDMQYLGEEKLEDTIISAHMEQPLEEGKNVVYCSTFQLCWNDMKDIFDDNIELVDGPEMVDFLNKSLSTKADISDEYYVAVAGFAGDNIEEDINRQLKSKFSEEVLVDYSGNADDDIIAYAYLYKNLEFAEEFESLETPLDFGAGNYTFDVEAFGIEDYSNKNKKMGEQVDIIDYNNYDDFIIRLNTKSSDDEIILAMVSPQNTLLETIEYVSNRVENGSNESMMEHDVLKIPKFSFNISHTYSELIDKGIENQPFMAYSISEAQQEISFVLDEKGAILKSISSFSLSKDDIESRYLVFNQPFLLYMKEEGAQYPYFAMWIENTDLMVSSD